METLVYLPSKFINENYNYFIEDNHYIVSDNNKCFNIYFDNNYIVSNQYECNTNGLIPLDYTLFIDNWHYRLDATNIYIVSSIYIFGICLIYLILFKTFRKGLNL